MRTVSGDLLTHEVIKTSKTFYRNQDLEVRIGGDTAATNGKMVMLPSIPTGVDYTPDEVAVVRGFVDHEEQGMDVTLTSLLQTQAVEGHAQAVHTSCPIANGLEDVRIERLITQETQARNATWKLRLHGQNNLYLERMPKTQRLPRTLPVSVLSASHGKVADVWVTTTRPYNNASTHCPRPFASK